ncbi:UNVERIFIED_CONTAM: hypothetical protein FKN15_012052 [Acipenser sinensis]
MTAVKRVTERLQLYGCPVDLHYTVVYQSALYRSYGHRILSTPLSPVRRGILFSTLVFGPACGFILGSLCTKFYVDAVFIDTSKLDITPDDPRWIGAWWGGFLLCGALLFFSALFMFGFPQSLSVQELDSGGESEQTMLPKSLPRDYERPKPSNGVVRNAQEPEKNPTCCQQMRGFIPPPLIFGAGIDSTCLIWSTVCGEDGACMLYDNTAYRYLYVSIAIALKTFAFILYTTTWLCLRRNYKSYIKNHEGGLNPSEMFASTLTLDNLGRDASQNPPDRTKFIYNLEAHEWCENMESVL